MILTPGMNFVCARAALFLAIALAPLTSQGRNVAARDCVAFAEASKHLGSNACVTGTVQHVEEGRGGAKILNFCKDNHCPFTVVVFPADLKKMGDIRQLEGRQIEIKGTVQDYDGRAEIVLRRSQQLGEGAFLLFPTVPTDYDVERPGHYSAGKFKRPKAAKIKHSKKGDPVPLEDPEEPQ
jgi:DNA/RNA endonuclease YhcR with UshA esterase domain